MSSLLDFDLNAEISRLEHEYRLKPGLLRSVVTAESGGDQSAVSSAGAVGLTQLMPGTAAGLGVDPNDPRQNLQGGAMYLRQQLDRFGRVDLALSAYNSGPAGSEGSGRVEGIPETQAYVERVQALMATYDQQFGVVDEPQGMDQPVSASQAGAPFEVSQPNEAATDSLLARAGPLSEMVAQESGGTFQERYPGYAARTGATSFLDPVDQAKLDYYRSPYDTGPADELDYVTDLPDGGVQGEVTPPRPGVVLPNYSFGGGVDAHMSRPLGNWQSDNAADLMAPAGTPIYAVDDGVIDPGAGFGFSDNGSTVWGFRMTLRTKDNAFFMTHMGAFAPGIKQGKKIKKGDLLGWVGDPGGRFPSHLHIGAEHGDPMDYVSPPAKKPSRPAQPGGPPAMSRKRRKRK